MINDRSKIIGFTLVILIVLALIALIYVAFIDVKKSSGPTGKYPQSVQFAIDNPVQINEFWKTLVTTDEYEISYSSKDGMDSFFITVNSQPALEVSLKAEKAFLQKLNIDEAVACELPLHMGVPSAVDSELSGYTFGLSFCLGKVHIADVIRNSEN